MFLELVLSFLRMLVAYIISMMLAYVVGYSTARDKNIERVVMPIVDVLQSVPILTFFPAVLFLFINNLPPQLGPEVAVISLIVTSMVWNLIFAVYESFISFPKNLLSLAKMYKIGRLSRFVKLYFPYSLKNIISNSMVSWANGWYFLIATEIIAVGTETYKLKGIGSLLLESALQSNYLAVAQALALVVTLIFAMNIFVWKPLVSLVSLVFGGKREENIYALVLKHIPYKALPSHSLHIFFRKVYSIVENLERYPLFNRAIDLSVVAMKYLLLVSAVLLISISISAVFEAILSMPEEAYRVPIAFIYSFVRILVAFLLSLIWVVPVGYLMFKSPLLDKVLLPVFEVLAAIPVTALFPVFVLLLANSLGLELLAIVFLMTGMQWYLFFNFYGSLKSIPRRYLDLKPLFRLKESKFLEKVLVPASLPMLVLGSISAIGGGWNAVIVAEYLQTKSGPLYVEGIGSLMTKALISGNIKMLVLSSLSVGIIVPLANIIFWRPMIKAFSSERWKL